MSRGLIIFIALFCTIVGASEEPGLPVSDARPNVIFIMADDLGYADLGVYGGRNASTPNLDALAQSGIRFTNAYAGASVCSPSRLALITGRYPGRFEAGLEEPIATRTDVGLDPQEVTLPRIFQDAGYNTVLVGKWHLGEAPLFSPIKSGYDYFYGIHSGGTDYFQHQFTLFGKEMGHLYEGENIVEASGYLTHLFTQAAIAQLRDAQQAQRPLFLSLHHTSPHWPWEGPADHDMATPSSPQHFDGGSLQTYKAMVEDLDDAVGQVMSALQELGMADNTIVVFASDNGGERFSDNWPFIGEKTELLEGGIRIPMIINWPMHLRTGEQSEQVISLVDMLPTLASIADVSLPEGLALDGLDLSGAVLGETPNIARDLHFRHKANEQKAIRRGDWKYLSIRGNEFLFNLKVDERERANLIQLYPEIAAELRTTYLNWEKTMLPYSESNYSHSMPSDKYADKY